MQADDPKMSKIGDLLVELGVLTTADLAEANTIAARMGVPIGRVLVTSGCITEDSLKSAVEAQSMMRDGLIDYDIAMKALGIVLKKKKPLRDALNELNWAPRSNATAAKLGELLERAQIVNHQQLDKAIEVSFQSGLPLGQVLVNQGALTPQLLPTALHLQEQVRLGSMSKEEAIEQLRIAVEYWQKAESSKQSEFQKPTASRTKIPSLSSMEKTVPQLQSDGALSSTSIPKPTSANSGLLPHQQPLGSASAAPAASAAAAGTTAGAAGQSNPSNGTAARPGEISQTMKAKFAEQSFASPSIHVRDTLAKLKPVLGETGVGGFAPMSGFDPGQGQAQGATVVELLKLAGYCNQAGIDAAVQKALNDPNITSKLLLAVGFIDQKTMDLFMRCHILITRGVIRTDQALYVLNSIKHRGISLEAALQELGITLQ